MLGGCIEEVDVMGSYREGEVETGRGRRSDGEMWGGVEGEAEVKGRCWEEG